MNRIQEQSESLQESFLFCKVVEGVTSSVMKRYPASKTVSGGVSSRQDCSATENVSFGLFFCSVRKLSSKKTEHIVGGETTPRPRL